METEEKDPPPMSNDILITNLAKDYAEYITPRVRPEAEALDDSIEELLTKLEEYCGLVDIVRSDTTLCLTRTLPEIHAKSKSMKQVFDRVDQLEVFVGMIKTHVATMEALLDQAEAEMGTSGVKRLLSAIPMPSFFGGRKPAPKLDRQLSKFEPPEVFRTEDFFPNSGGTDVGAEASSEAATEEKMDAEAQKQD